METTQEHPWLIALSTPLDDKKTQSAVSETHPDWEYIDGEMIKLGTISHQQFDIKEVQHRALILLETETKDMRVLAHLLRTLQHQGESNDMLLALVLFHRYIALFWETAYPNERLKLRLAMQIMKRFSQNADGLGEAATAADREIALACLAQLNTQLADKQAALGDEITSLVQRIRHADEASQSAPAPESTTAAQTSASPQHSATHASPSVSIPATSTAHINIDNSNERAWKNTLIKVAEHLFDQFPDRDISYRVRRTAIWLTTDGILQCDENQVTPLGIPVSQDRLSEYIAAIPNATVALLKQVENSLTLSPYWFEGHHIAARIAIQLGYTLVAEAIRAEVSQVLARVPALLRFRFSDQSPFVNESVQKWLQSTDANATLQTHYDDSAIWQCYQEQGLETALQLIEATTPTEKREHYYQQRLATQLMEEAGLTNMAQQQRKQIQTIAKQLTVYEWEPSFFTLLETTKDD